MMSLSESWILKNISRIQILVLILSSVVLLLVIVTYIKWGPALQNDLIYYFHMAGQIGKGSFPYSNGYSPGYPAIVHFTHYVSHLDFIESSTLLCAIFYLSAWILLYYSTGILFDLKQKKMLAILASFILLNSWWSLKIILRVHADGFFYVFHLAILLTLLLFLTSKNIRWFLLCSVLAALAVWVKYNGLIYLPYLAVVPFLFWGWKRIALFGVIPVLLVGSSFFVFRSINHNVIHHLEISESSFSLWQGDISFQTLYTNVKDSGKVLISGLSSNAFASLLPNVVAIVYFLIVIALLVYYIFKTLGKQNLPSVILAFTVIYIFGFILMSQRTNLVEVNLRTFFPVTLFFLLGLFGLLLQFKVYIGYYFIVLFIFFQPVQSIAGLVNWYRHAPMDSFKKANVFKSKKSLIRLRELMRELDVDTGNIYTNEIMYLAIYFDYNAVEPAPGKKQFGMGTYTIIDDQAYEELLTKFKSDIRKGASILFLVDSDMETVRHYGGNEFRYEKIQNDFIIYR